MSDDSLSLENAHEHKNVFPFVMAEIASRRAVAGLARRRASAAWLTGHGRVQNVKARVERVRHCGCIVCVYTMVYTIPWMG